MTLKLNDKYHGFILNDVHKVNEVDSTAFVFEHEKTGARLLYLQNSDDNKVFSATFRTPPNDNTGVAHIVEHCVLSGSRKYKTKEPFMDLVKGSLNTFINAMTFSDKTMYPVASQNDKDFENLMDVYLDSVFFPKIYQEPEIFMQEGWHYEIENADDPIRYNGVVYNEMLGAYSSPTRILSEYISRTLYPETCYAFESGGNPAYIPDLTLEQFKAFHKSYYHPSNSFLYLYGDLDILSKLEHIDSEYLSKFERIEIDSHIPPVEPLDTPSHFEGVYPISETESEDNKTYLCKAYYIGETAHPIDNIACEVLKQVLITSNASPVKKALIDAGIGEDIMSSGTDGRHITLSIISKNASANQLEDFEKTIQSTLIDLVENGIDRSLIESSLNIVEYDLREANRFPTKGIIYHMSSMESWLYDGSPTEQLQYNEVFNTIHSQIDHGFFENMIQERLLGNKHTSTVVLRPEKNLTESETKALEEKLSLYKKSLSQQEIEALIQENALLKKKQLTPDTPEAQATIPALSVSDVEKDVKKTPQEVESFDHSTLLYHDIFANNISYVDLLFDIQHMELDQVPYVNLLSQLLGNMDTTKRSYGDLSNEVYIHTGGINMSAFVIVENLKADMYHPRFVIRSKAIGEKTKEMLELINEMIFDTKLDDKKRLLEILQKIKSRSEMRIIQNGNSVISRRLASYTTAASKLSDKMMGLDYYWFVSDLVKNFDSNADTIIDTLKSVYKTVFNANNLVISFTGEQKDYAFFKSKLPLMTDQLNKDSVKKITYAFEDNDINEGIGATSNVQYVGKGSNFLQSGHAFTGTLNVLQTILNTEYLHNHVRAKGGAYGCNMLVGRAGNLIVTSYRDPRLKETLDVYDEIYKYIESFDMSQEELDKFIIGTIGSLDSAETPHMKARAATANYIGHIGYDDLQKERDEVLSTTPEHIRSLAPLIKDVVTNGQLCVLGNDSKIKENSNVFNIVKSLLS